MGFKPVGVAMIFPLECCEGRGVDGIKELAPLTLDVSDIGSLSSHLLPNEFLKLVASLLVTGAADVNALFAFGFGVMYFFRGQPYFDVGQCHSLCCGSYKCEECASDQLVW